MIPQKSKAAFAASLIYAAITLCLVLNHEIWADGREILFNGGGPLRFSKLNDPILIGNSQLTEKGFYLISIAESAGETSILPGTKKIGKDPCFYKTRQAIKRGETFCLSYYMNQKTETEE